MPVTAAYYKCAKIGCHHKYAYPFTYIKAEDIPDGVWRQSE